MGKAVWTGSLVFQGIAIPVKVFKATRDTTKISLCTCHSKDMGRARQKLFCEVCGEEIQRGVNTTSCYELGSELIPMTDAEIAGSRPERGKTMRILGVVKGDPTKLIPETAITDAYFVGGEEGAGRTYSLLRDALDKGKFSLIVQFVKAKSEILGILRNNGLGLIIYEIRYASELLEASDVPMVEGNVTASQVEKAVHILEKMAGDFNYDGVKETYSTMIREIVEAKALGGTPLIAEKMEAKAEGDLDSLLDLAEKSVDA